MATVFKKQRQLGFSVPETIIVLGIVAILASFAVISLFTVQHRSSFSSTVSILKTDIRQQQMKAMTGDTEGASLNSDYGVYFETNRYTLFRGSSYNPQDAANFKVNLEGNLQFDLITFPQTTLVFSKGSGEMVGFVQGANRVTVQNSVSGEIEQITINRYGVVTLSQ